MKSTHYRMTPAGEAGMHIVPAGGVCLSRPANDIGDDQSPDMWNMWHDGRSLTLRPGLRRSLEQAYGAIAAVCPADGRTLLLKRITCAGQVVSEKHGIYIATGRAVLAWDGTTLERLPSYLSYLDGGWQRGYDDLAISQCVMLASGDYCESETDSAGRLWEAAGDSVYLFGSGYFLTLAPQLYVWPVSAADLEVTADYTASYRVPYVPTVTVETAPTGSGKTGEALNFLTGRVRQSYTADSASTVYRLTMGTLDDSEVTVEYDDPVSGESHVFWFPEGFPADTEDGITAELDRTAGTVTFSTAPLGKTGVTNNVRITYGRTDTAENPVFACTAGSWYGGVAGQGGGNRIFLSGNPAHRSLVYYCAPDNPGYFPRDAVIAVGEPADAVTAFGRQFNILVIFKEHGVYSLAGADDGSFTVNLVHSGNGCDMPGSVQRIRNELVWGNSREGLFLLHSTQIKDERTVVGISGNIGPLLLAQSPDSLAAAGSLDDGGNYYLVVGPNVFVWQYGDLSAQNGRLVQAQPLYRFAVWNMPFALGTPFRWGSGLCAADSGGTVWRLDETVGDDDGTWFDAGWRSKAFDLGAPERLKSLTGLWAEVESDGPLQVEIGCAVPGGEECRALWVGPEDGGLYRVGLPRVQGRTLQVTVRRCREETGRFGIRGLELHALPGPPV